VKTKKEEFRKVNEMKNNSILSNYTLLLFDEDGKEIPILFQSAAKAIMCGTMYVLANSCCDYKIIDNKAKQSDNKDKNE
jgi:hypothetical protein